MTHKLGQLRVVPKPQREHVAGASEDDGLPPPILKRLLGDDEMTRRDLIPGPGQAGRNRQVVFVFADGGLRFELAYSGFNIGSAGQPHLISDRFPIDQPFVIH